MAANTFNNVSTPLIARYAVKNAIHNCYPDAQFSSGGTDCDRSGAHITVNDSDIAKYAKNNKCHVIMNDTDFFVFDVPGVIYLDWMLEDIKKNSELTALMYTLTIACYGAWG